MNDIFWLVGLYRGSVGLTDHKPIHAFDIIGIYDNEEKAVAACTTINHWCGPLKLNETMPDETQEWLGAYYPKSMKNE